MLGQIKRSSQDEAVGPLQFQSRIAGNLPKPHVSLLVDSVNECTVGFLEEVSSDDNAPHDCAHSPE